MAATKRVSYEPTVDASASVFYDGNYYLQAQTLYINSGSNFDISSIKLTLKKKNSPTGDLNVYLCATTGTPGDPVFGTVYSSGTIDSSTLSSTDNVEEIAMSSYRVVNGGYYSIILKGQSSWTSNYVDCRIKDSGGYSGGQNHYSANNGVDWSSYVGDFYFEIWGTDPVAETNMKLNVGDAWKTVSALKVNVGDSWKAVTKAKVNIGDTWKTVF